MRRQMLLTLVCLLAAPAGAEELKFRDRLVGELAEQVPAILKGFDAQTGRFGSGIWICRDQHDMYPLAVACATPGPANPYYKDTSLLEVIVKAGDALDRPDWCQQAAEFMLKVAGRQSPAGYWAEGGGPQPPKAASRSACPSMKTIRDTRSCCTCDEFAAYCTRNPR